MKACFICLAISIAVPVFAQDNGAQHIKEGNDLFKKGSLPEAIAAYDKATSGTNKYVALVNKGDALFRLKKYDEALKSYQQANEAGNTDADLRSGAFYNAGVVYSNQNKLDESIEAYKNALRLNSNDVNARENLQKALLEKKKQSGGGGGGGKDKNDQSQQQKSKLSQSQSQNKLDKLEEKEKNTQERISENKSQYATSNAKDW